MFAPVCQVTILSGGPTSRRPESRMIDRLGKSQYN